MTDHRGVPTKVFHEMYAAGPPAWEIGQPQPAVVQLLEEGWFRGSLLDIGCGTGENAMLLAERGFSVLGIDAVPKAIEAARKKATERGLTVKFEVADALKLEDLGQQFDTVLDSALFHVFSDADRPRVLAGMRSVTRPGGRLLLICFSEEEKSEFGPRRLTRAELEGCFAQGWELERLEPTRYGSTTHEGGAKAWLGIWQRV